ncbi:MAG: transcriptional activator RfaH [Rhodobacteraceae bacterium]|nr:transcriptional activator RfaH [Paracoccaceae bacterium]
MKMASAHHAWFVAQLKPNGFALAKSHLQRQGYETFMPMQTRTVRHARKERRVQRPLFAGYIFISFNPLETQWRAINSTFGVVALVVARRNTPQQVPDGLMRALMARCDPKGNILPLPVFNPGDKVRVISGPFRDAMAEVEQASEGERVRLLFELMGRAVVADCAGSELELLHG